MSTVFTEYLSFHTNKTECHDINAILLNVALNTNTSYSTHVLIWYALPSPSAMYKESKYSAKQLIKFNIFSIKLIYFLEMLIPCFIARIC